MRNLAILAVCLALAWPLHATPSRIADTEQSLPNAKERNVVVKIFSTYPMDFFKFFGHPIRKTKVAGNFLKDKALRPAARHVGMPALQIARTTLPFACLTGIGTIPCIGGQLALNAPSTMMMVRSFAGGAPQIRAAKFTRVKISRSSVEESSRGRYTIDNWETADVYVFDPGHAEYDPKDRQFFTGYQSVQADQIGWANQEVWNEIPGKGSVQVRLDDPRIFYNGRYAYLTGCEYKGKVWFNRIRLVHPLPPAEPQVTQAPPPPAAPPVVNVNQPPFPNPLNVMATVSGLQPAQIPTNYTVHVVNENIQRCGDNWCRWQKFGTGLLGPAAIAADAVFPWAMTRSAHIQADGQRDAAARRADGEVAAANAAGPYLVQAAQARAQGDIGNGNAIAQGTRDAGVSIQNGLNAQGTSIQSGLNNVGTSIENSGMTISNGMTSAAKARVPDNITQTVTNTNSATGVNNPVNTFTPTNTFNPTNNNNVTANGGNGGSVGNISVTAKGGNAVANSSSKSSASSNAEINNSGNSATTVNVPAPKPQPAPKPAPKPQPKPPAKDCPKPPPPPAQCKK
ncbi:MAG TPA: hypothetical protein VHF05_00030 [Candidatus Paceibacterota bacterium]|jgi:hypothetical protein|nr:hypothetical protein [Candidatus Paceibacterota bacterium]